MNDTLVTLGRWQLEVKAVRERMYGAPTARERKRWHASGCWRMAGSAVQVAEALELAGFIVDSPYRVSALLYRGVIYLAQGKIAEAQSALDGALPPGAAMDIVLLRELLQALLHYAAGDEGQMQAALNELAHHAQATGHLVYRRESLRLAQIAPLHPALAALPRLVSCPADRLSGFLAESV